MDGSRDPHFGHDGSTTFGIRGAEEFVGSATAKGGALYLAGGGCCFTGIPGYVVRVSAGGKLDNRFTAASQHSLRSLQKLDFPEESVNAVVVRPRGRIELLGSAGYEKGFLMRLRGNGHLHRRFGRKGLLLITQPISSAAPGSDGTTLAVSDENLGGADVLMRFLPNGHRDPAFGPEGVEIPEAQGDAGLSVVHQTGRKALVLDLGLHECRGYCGANPKLVRFLEGAPKQR
jgi:hypothetical protein